MTDRFDQKPDEPYGHCKTCAEAGVELTFADQTEMSAHLRETFDAGGRVNGQGHTGSTTNPTRAERIRTHVGFAIENALYEFIEDVDNDIDREYFTDEEVREALRGHSDFYDAWIDREES